MYLPAAPGFKLQAEAKGLSTQHSTTPAQAITTFCVSVQTKKYNENIKT